MALKPIKHFGQHFLIDQAIADNIIREACIYSSEPVWEIGPGKGVLTERILEHTDDLTAFEIDNRLATLLQNRFGSRLQLVNKDILACDWPALLAEQTGKSGQKIKLISNLPYQITSPVLYDLEANAAYFSGVILMLQREVADRLTAIPCTKAYSVLTLRIKLCFEVETLFLVPPTAFDPPPQVWSSVIRLIPRQEPLVVKSLDMYRKLIQTAFSQRRKTLRNNLRRMFTPAELDKLELLCGIDFKRRGETLAEAEFACLADHAAALSGA